MSLWEWIDHEKELLREERERASLEPRTWSCDPLVVVDATDGSIAFQGRTDVDVTPHADGTADLLAHGDRDGWQPTLVNAVVKRSGSGALDVGAYGAARRGLVCSGQDAEGNAFRWYINGGADVFAGNLLVAGKLTGEPVDDPPPLEELG